MQHVFSVCVFNIRMKFFKNFFYVLLRDLNIKNLNCCCCSYGFFFTYWCDNIDYYLTRRNISRFFVFFYRLNRRNLLQNLFDFCCCRFSEAEILLLKIYFWWMAQIFFFVLILLEPSLVCVEMKKTCKNFFGRLKIWITNIVAVD